MNGGSSALFMEGLALVGDRCGHVRTFHAGNWFVGDENGDTGNAGWRGPWNRPSSDIESWLRA